MRNVEIISIRKWHHKIISFAFALWMLKIDIRLTFNICHVKYTYYIYIQIATIIFPLMVTGLQWGKYINTLLSYSALRSWIQAYNSTNILLSFLEWKKIGSETPKIWGPRASSSMTIASSSNLPDHILTTWPCHFKNLLMYLFCQFCQLL